MKPRLPIERLILVGMLGLAGGGLVLHTMLRAQREMNLRARQRERDTAEAFEQLLDTCRTMAANGAWEEGAERLAAADNRRLTHDQQRRLVLSMAEVTACACPASAGFRDNFHAQLALHYYARAAAMATSAEQQAETRLARARFMARLSEWQEVSALLDDLDPAALTRSEAATATLLRAEAFTRLGEYREALHVLDEVLEVERDPEMRAAAILRQAELLFCLSEEDPSRLENLPSRRRQPPEVLRNQAADLLQEVLATASPNGPLPNRARLALLRLAAVEGDSVGAYRLANRLRVSGASTSEKAEAQLLIAGIEERNGDALKAIEILQRYLEMYPQRPDYVEVYDRFHELLVANDRWHRLLSFVSQAQQRRFELDVFRRLLREFQPEGRAYDGYAVARPGTESVLEGMLNLIDLMAETDPERFALAADNAAFTRGVINYALERYEASETNLAAYQWHGDAVDKLEAAAFLDILCALERDLPLPIRAWRCRNYLGRFPEGPHQREIMALLLRTYYEMGLYAAARDIARKILIGDLMAMDDGGADVSSDQWLTTVIRLAQCYAQLGDHQRADLIFRMYANRIASHPFAAEVYTAWSRSAARRQQLHEAVRRLDVALMQVKDENERLGLELERNVRAMQIPLPGAATSTRELLDVLEGGGEMNADRQRLVRQAYEALLMHCAEKDKEQFRELRDRAIRSFGGEPWVEYWTLRSLTGLFGHADLAELEAEHRRILELRAEQPHRDEETARFIGRQLTLIEALTELRQRQRELQARGLN